MTEVHLTIDKSRFFSILEPQLNSEESRLRKSLLRNYVPEARPVINRTTVTVVDVGLTIIQVMHLVSESLCFN